MLDMAIVGLGGIGNAHGPCYQKIETVKLVAVCDIIKERADKAAEKYSCPAFYSVKEMLASGVHIDAASVCTAGKENGGDHYEPTMQLLRAGIPVLGEKPISNEVSKAKEMVALAKEKGLRYGVNLNHRFTPAAKRAKEWLDAGRCGEINQVNMFMWINNPNETSPHFHMRTLHPHSLDVMRYFGGDVKKVHAFFKCGHNRVGFSHVHVNLMFESGVIGHLMGSYDGGGPGHHWGLEKCEIVGHDARIVITDACEQLDFQPRKTIEAESYKFLGNMRTFGETFQSRINAWVDDLVKQTPPDKVDAKAEDALKAQLIIEAAIESFEKEKVVMLWTTDMLKACVIGMGPIGNRHADMYAHDPLAKLIGVCDIRKDRADGAAARLGVAGFTDTKQMLDALKPDLCSVTTGGYEYGSDHYQPTIDALSAGCHVLGEKPISNDIQQAQKMVALAREKGKCYGINLNHRFTPAARVAKRWLDEGKLGHLLFVNMSMWIKNPNESSPYFQIKALHPHTVDVMRYFCGDVESVQCFATKAPGRKIWSTAHFSMKFKNGVVGGLSGSYDIERGHPMERCEVAGTGGRFVLEDMWREATLYPAGNMEKTVYTNPLFGGFRDFEDTFKDRIHRFLEQVTAKVPPEQIDGSGADGLAAQKVLAAAIESLDNGTVVKVK